MAVTRSAVELTHKQAVRRIAGWLSNIKRYPIVMAERVCANVTEQPDVIGWRGSGVSVLVECKVSRSDFLADKGKVFRRVEDLGVGDLRYYAAPRGLLSADDIPPGWGLLELCDGSVRETVKPEPKSASKVAEVAMLVAGMRRLEVAATVFVRHGADAEDPAP